MAVTDTSTLHDATSRQAGQPATVRGVPLVPGDLDDLPGRASRKAVADAGERRSHPASAR
jgi:hypothetical protein